MYPKLLFMIFSWNEKLGCYFHDLFQFYFEQNQYYHLLFLLKFSKKKKGKKERFYFFPSDFIFVFFGFFSHFPHNSLKEILKLNLRKKSVISLTAPTWHSFPPPFAVVICRHEITKWIIKLLNCLPAHAASILCLYIGHQCYVPQFNPVGIGGTGLCSGIVTCDGLVSYSKGDAFYLHNATEFRAKHLYKTIAAWDILLSMNNSFLKWFFCWKGKEMEFKEWKIKYWNEIWSILIFFFYYW